MKQSILLFCALLFTSLSYAQPPQKMSYQTVIRNATDDLVSNTTVGIQISVLQGSSAGTAVYVETHAPMTNANGLASLEIGAGTPLTGTMAAIDWGSGPYFVKSEVDIAGGTNYTLSLVSELLSVPYALHAFSSGDGQWPESGGGINTSNFVVGINSPAPQHTLDVRSLSPADPAGLNVSNSDVSRYVRFFSGSEEFPDPSMSWAPGHELLFATFDDNTFDFSEKMRISSLGDVGIGIPDPEARLDILGGDWNLDAGNPGDLRIGNETYNFRIGVATGGGGAGVTRLYTNFNTLILGANDVASLVLEPDGRIIAPFLSNTLIDDGGDKALVTKEYADENYGGGASETKSITYPGSYFRRGSSSDSQWSYNGFYATGSGFSQFLAPIILPAGSVIHEIKVYVRPGGFGQNISATLRQAHDVTWLYSNDMLEAVTSVVDDFEVLTLTGDLEILPEYQYVLGVDRPITGASGWSNGNQGVTKMVVTYTE
jgi:hypothetical protein